MTDKPDEAKMREILGEELGKRGFSDSAACMEKGETDQLFQAELAAMQRAYELGRADFVAKMSDIDGCNMDSETLCGRLRLSGHRVSIGQVIAEIAECDGVKLFAANYDLREEEVIQALNGLSLWIDTIRSDRPRPLP